MKKLFVFFFLFVLAFDVFGQVRVKLDDRVSVGFPSAPTQSEAGGNPMWIADIDSNLRCMALVVDLEKLGIDSTALAPMLEQDEFYQQVKTGSMSQLGNIKFVEDKKFMLQGKHVYEYVLEKEIPDASFNYKRVYTRCIFLGAKMYSLSFLQKKPADDQRQKFFESLKIND